MDTLTIVIVAVIILLGLIIGGAVAFSRSKAKSVPTLKAQSGNDDPPMAGNDGPALGEPEQHTDQTIGVPKTHADP